MQNLTVEHLDPIHDALQTLASAVFHLFHHRGHADMAQIDDMKATADKNAAMLDRIKDFVAKQKTTDTAAVPTAAMSDLQTRLENMGTEISGILNMLGVPQDDDSSGSGSGPTGGNSASPTAPVTVTVADTGTTSGSTAIPIVPADTAPPTNAAVAGPGIAPGTTTAPGTTATVIQLSQPITDAHDGGETLTITPPPAPVPPAGDVGYVGTGALTSDTNTPPASATSATQTSATASQAQIGGVLTAPGTPGMTATSAIEATGTRPSAQQQLQGSDQGPVVDVVQEVFSPNNAKKLTDPPSKS